VAVELSSQVGSFCFGVYLLIIVKLLASSLITHCVQNPGEFFSFHFFFPFPATWEAAPASYVWGYLDLDVDLGE